MLLFKVASLHCLSTLVSGRTLGTMGGRTAKHPLYTDVFINIWPVNALSITDYLEILTLVGSCL
nr:hypothetical protein [Desulforhabdus amnigena]